MGRLYFFGERVPQFLDSVVTRRVVDLKPNQVRYALVCDESGGILDDVLVYGGTSDHRPPFSMVVNASNREKIVSWLNTREPDLKIDDKTQSTAMIAVQGPKAVAMLDEPIELNSLQLRNMRYYHYAGGYFEGEEVFVSRTGYTGEDGFEIICGKSVALEIWESLIARAARLGGLPAGLAARDTLRVESAMPLYGHELSEAINPFQAGLGFAVNLGGREFIGRKALERFAADKSQPVRVGLQVDGKRVPRQGCPVLHGDEVVGEVTSGTFSPTFVRPIAMAYVRPSAHAVGTRLGCGYSRHTLRRGGGAIAVLRARKEGLATEDTEDTESQI